MKKEFEVILSIVNKGFADLAMDAARNAGAGGGTIISGRGTANPDAEEFFNISVIPAKEILMILAPKDKVDNILQTLYDAVGMKTDGQGIAFSLPVDNVVGLPEKQLKEAQE